MSASTTLNRLKLLEGELRAKGVCALYLFGSVARGESTSDSDIDLSFDIAPDVKFSLFDQAQIMCDLTEALGAKVDLVPRRAIHPYIRARVEAEQIRVFG
jgi:predicted nucleotidyltransferase